jgi:ABC-type Fe3+/spermidine/putrescine transport system ATPase subunit
VVLSNGDRLQLQSDHETGESVAITVRPERLKIHKKGEGSTDQHQLDGIVETVGYLGNAIVYSVSIDWMHLEVRSSETSNSRYSTGDEVTVSFDPRHVSVVSG